MNYSLNVVFQLQSQKEHLSNLNPKTDQMHNLTTPPSPSPISIYFYPKEKDKALSPLIPM